MKKVNQKEMEAKVVVLLNFVSTGKTKMARQLFQPRMPNSQIVPIETINSDENQKNALAGDDFRKTMRIIDESVANDFSVIVDVGVSNVEAFLKKMKIERAEGEFDLFVIPTNPIDPDEKAIKNTIRCVEELRKKYNVPAEKIVVLFNRANPFKTLYEGFGSLLDYHRDTKNFRLVEAAVVHESDAFTMIPDHLILDNIIADTTDLKVAMREAPSESDKIAISNLRALRRMSPPAIQQMDEAFCAIFS